MTDDLAAQTVHRRGVADADVERWVVLVAEALPSLDSREGQTALEALVDWGVRFVPPLVWRLAARYGLPDDVRNRMLERPVIRDELRLFFTCSTGDSTASGPAVAAYLDYGQAARSRGESARSFSDWCFYGTRTRLFSYLKRAAVLYGASPELFRSRDSGKTAIRRLVLTGSLIEYLKLTDRDTGEHWCQRTGHPNGSSPPNAFAYGQRRFFPREDAEQCLEFVITPTHMETEKLLVDQLLRSAGALHLEYFGASNNPTIVLSIFQRLVQPAFPLLGTTLDAVFAAKARVRVGDLDSYSAEQWRQDSRESATEPRDVGNMDSISEERDDD